MRYQIAILLLSWLAACWQLPAQSLIEPPRSLVEVTLGHAWEPAKGSQGFTVAFGYERHLRGRHFYALEMRHSYTDARGMLPADIAGDRYGAPWYFQDYSNPYPNLSRYPGHHFPSRPNRYFNFNMGVQYRYEWLRAGKHRLRSGLGLVFTYRDEVEIAQVVEVEAFSSFLARGIHFVPIYRYNSFLDFGFTPELAYRYQLSERLALGVQSQLSYFPGPGHAILATGATLGVALGPRVYRLQGRQKSGR